MPKSGHSELIPPSGSTTPWYRKYPQKATISPLESTIDGYHDVLPSGFDIFVGLEAETAAIRSYEISVVPGLLQTPDYARAVLREMFPRYAVEPATIDAANRLLESDGLPQLVRRAVSDGTDHILRAIAARSVGRG